MPVYFGHPLPTSSRGNKPEVSPVLSKKGIELLRAAPSDTNIYGVPVAKTTFWGVFQALFSVIIASLCKKTSFSLWPPGQEIDRQHPHPLPFRLPPLCVSLHSFSQAGIDFLLANGFEEADIRGGTYFLNSNVHTGIISSLIARDCPAKVNEKCFTPFRFVNLHAMYTVLDLISWFSYACHAMDFMIAVNDDDDDSNFDQLEPQEIKRAELDTETLPDASELVDIPAGYHPIRRLFRGDIPTTFLDQYPGGTVNSKCIRDNRPYTSANSFTIAYSGHILRFVQELADVDPRVVISFLLRFMFQNIGSDENDRIVVMSQVRSAWGLIQSTDFGLELSHLAKCLEIALDTGVRLKAIFDANFYEGCIITGEGYKLAIHDRLIAPLSSGDLATELLTLATHVNALTEIRNIAARESGDLANAIMNSQSMVSLRSILIGLPLTESTKDAIVSTAASLRFPSRPWNINVVSIKSMIEIAKDVSLLKDSYPISPRALFSNDSITVAISCFGESSCPSFFNANGTPINLEGTLPSAPRESGRPAGKQKGKQQTSNASWTFAVRRVRFDEAVADLRKVLKEKMARSVSTTVARGTGCVVFQGKVFSEIFALLQGLCRVLDGSAQLTRTNEDSRMVADNEADGGVSLVGHRSKRIKI